MQVVVELILMMEGAAGADDGGDFQADGGGADFDDGGAAGADDGGGAQTLITEGAAGADSRWWSRF